MYNKICKCCNLEKKIDDFPKNGIYIRSKCKECSNKYNKIWKEENPNYMLTWKENNPDKIKRYRNTDSIKNKDKYLTKNKEYYDNNTKYIIKRNIEYRNNKLKTDPYFKFIHNSRNLIRNAFKRKFTTKSKKTTEILGCNFEEFKQHIESKFDNNMNWQNHGSYWVLDHIIPISSAITNNDIILLNHYTNFQPLFWLDNLIKSNKIL